MGSHARGRRVTLAIGVAAVMVMGAIFDPALAVSTALPTGTIQAGDNDYQGFANTVSPVDGGPAGFGLFDVSEDDGGRSDAIDGGFHLTLNGKAFTDKNNAIDVTPDAALLGAEGVRVTASGKTAGFKVSLQIALFGGPDGGPNNETARLLYTIKNPTRRAKSVTALFNTNYGSDSSTVVEDSTNGNTSCNSNDSWCLSSDDGTTDDDAISDPTVNTVFGDLSDIFQYHGFNLGSATEQLQVGRKVKIKKRKSVQFLFFYHFDDSVGGAETDAQNFDTLATLNAQGLLVGTSGTFQNWTP